MLSARTRLRFRRAAHREAHGPLPGHHSQLLHPLMNVKLGSEDRLVYPEGCAFRQERRLALLCVKLGIGELSVEAEACVWWWWWDLLGAVCDATESAPG